MHLTKHGHGESRAAIVIDDDEYFRPCRVEAELDDPEGQYFGVLGDHNDEHGSNVFKNFIGLLVEN